MDRRLKTVESETASFNKALSDASEFEGFSRTLWSGLVENKRATRTFLTASQHVLKTHCEGAFS